MPTAHDTLSPLYRKNTKKILFRVPAEMIVGCILNWKGIAFTENMTYAMNALTMALRQSRAIIEVVVRDDNYTMPLAYAFAKSNQPIDENAPTHRERDLAALHILNESFGTDLQNGTRFIPTKEFMDALRALYKTGVSREFCASCRFSDMCTSIANNDFRETKLLSPIAGLNPF